MRARQNPATKSEKEIIDIIISAQESVTTSEAVGLLERLVGIDIDTDIINKIVSLDDAVTKKSHEESEMGKLKEAIDNTKTKITDIEYDINGLYITREKLINNFDILNEMYIVTEGMIDDYSRISKNLRNEILDKLNAAEQKAKEEAERKAKEEAERKAKEEAERKANDILVDLPEEVKEALIRKLGITVSTNVVEANSADVIINMIDGSTITSSDGTWTWSEIKSHVVDVSQRRIDKMSEKMAIYVASLSLSRAEIARNLNSNHYASVVINRMTELGLYKKRKPIPLTDEQKKMRAEKSAAARKRNTAAKKAIQEAANQ